MVSTPLLQSSAFRYFPDDSSGLPQETRCILATGPVRVLHGPVLALGGASLHPALPRRLALSRVRVVRRSGHWSVARTGVEIAVPRRPIGAVPLRERFADDAEDRRAVLRDQLQPLPHALRREVDPAEEDARHQVADLVGRRFVGNGIERRSSPRGCRSWSTRSGLRPAPREWSSSAACAPCGRARTPASAWDASGGLLSPAGRTAASPGRA